MRIEKDPNRVGKLAKQRERANWNFRCYLKQSGIPASRIDESVHSLYREVLQRIDCTQCANCCKQVTPHLGPTDVSRIARHLGLRPSEFTRRYLKQDPAAHGEGLVLNCQPCAFLKDKSCSVYEARPRDCRSFPHLHKRDFVFRVTQAFANCSLCPIVFNVYEGLKRQFWYCREQP